MGEIAILNGQVVPGFPKVEFQRSHVYQTEYGWGRRPDDMDWHSVRYNSTERIYIPRCGAQNWPHSKGDALLPITTGIAFGPVCLKCERLEMPGDLTQETAS